MPRISAFFGIVIFMYWNEAEHHRPHFHASTANTRGRWHLTAPSSVATRRPARSASYVSGPHSTRRSLPRTGSALAPWSLSNGLHRSRNICSVEDVLPLLHVTGVAVNGDHKLRLLYEDGTVGDISFTDHNWSGVFEPLRDPIRFAKVRVEHGTIVWPEEGLDMAPEPLYQEARRHALSRSSQAAA